MVKFRRPRSLFRGRMLTAGRCTTHGPCFWAPNHHVWYFWVVLGLARCLRWNTGMELGRSQLHVRSVGGFSRARTVGTSLLSRLDGQVWFPGVTHCAIKRCPCAPSEPVLHSSGIVVTSEHAVTSCFFRKSRRLCGISWFRHVSCTPRMVSTFGRHAVCTSWPSWS